MAQSFRDLAIWQKGVKLTGLVYRLSREFPKEELYGLTSQIRRAAVSIPSNIAEGAGRLNSQEYRQFLGIARASSFEVLTHLAIAREIEFGDEEKIVEAELLCNELGRMIFRLIAAMGEHGRHSHGATRKASISDSDLHTHTSHSHELR